MSLTCSGQPKLARKAPSLKTDQKPESRALKPRHVAADQSTLETAPKHNKDRSKAADHPTQDRVPNSEEAEQAVLGSILISKGECIPEVRRRLPVHFLYSPVHVTIYQALLDMWDSGDGLDLITFTQFLRDRKLLDTVGGHVYVTNLFTFVPTAVNVEYYIEIVREKFFLREMITTGASMARAGYGASDADLPRMLDEFADKLARMRTAAGGPNGSELFSISNLMSFDSKHDPDCLVGNRYLVRGGSSLWAGGSGYGKSSLILQLAVYWVCGVPCFGLTPIRPLKCLIVEAENNEGDMAEQLQGVFNGVSRIGELDLEGQNYRGLIDKNLIIRRTLKTGLDFLGLLDDLLESDRPDIAWIDPLFAFAGCDLMNQKETTRFLRDGLFQISEKRKVALNVVHHIGKPVRDSKSKSEMADVDYQYLGFGSSEIQNSFRAVNILVPIANTGVFKLVLSKRGQRAGALNPEGHWTRTLYLKHSSEGDICWLQSEEPETGRPASHNLEDLLDQMSLIHAHRTSELRDKCKEEAGMSQRSFYRLFKEAKDKGKIRLQDGAWVLKPKRELK